jgi:hypothetical protein
MKNLRQFMRLPIESSTGVLLVVIWKICSLTCYFSWGLIIVPRSKGGLLLGENYFRGVSFLTERERKKSE